MLPRTPRPFFLTTPAGSLARPTLRRLAISVAPKPLSLEGGGKADDQALMRGAALRMMLVKRRSVARSTRVGLAHISALARIPVKIASMIAGAA